MGNSNISSKIIYSSSPREDLEELLSDYSNGKIFFVTEEHVEPLWLPVFRETLNNQSIQKIVLPAGEQNKGLSSVTKLWEFLSSHGADRKSLLVCLGGGMLTDLAGFAASTFKRGIDTINIPTTLLSQVDASVGGKTGINFSGLKNEIGTFREPVAVIIATEFLKTIDHSNFLSGFAEMIKHGLIKSKDHLEELRSMDTEHIDYSSLQEAIRHSVHVKAYFVLNDPTEKNIRKSLNFGHTMGHAFESLAMEQNRPVLHGYAVAWGMIGELALSVRNCDFPVGERDQITRWLLDIYGKLEIATTDFDRLFELMTHDKKNEAGRINFTLLAEPGRVKINQNCEKKMIFEALDYYHAL
jgi:3-dehydroquinate synthase